MAVKKNVVNTIRRVVDVVGKYAGGSLPDPAKQKVKGFILSLPGRWSVAVKEAGLGENWGDAGAEEPSTTAEGNSTSRAGPPPSSNPRKRNRLESSSQSVTSESTAVASVITSSSISAGSSSANLVSSSRPGVVGPPGAKRQQLLPPTAGAARHAASRVLTLAQESLHAVKGVTGVFKDTLDRAEA
jgi:transcriptional repressor OPI1